jgi:hypothetical protein
MDTQTSSNTMLYIALGAGALLLAGAYSIITSKTPVAAIPEQGTNVAQTEEQMEAQAQVGAALPAQNSSNDTASIEADLKAMNIDAFNAQTAADAAQFGASAQ